MTLATTLTAFASRKHGGFIMVCQSLINSINAVSSTDSARDEEGLRFASRCNFCCALVFTAILLAAAAVFLVEGERLLVLIALAFAVITFRVLMHDSLTQAERYREARFEAWDCDRDVEGIIEARKWGQS